MKRSVVTTPDQLKEVVDHYSSVRHFAFDVETRGEDRREPLIAEVAWLSLSTDGRADVIPFGHIRGNEKTTRRKPTMAARRRMELKGISYEELPPSSLLKGTETLWLDEPPEQLPRGVVMEAMAPVFAGDALKVGHNIKFDLHALAKYLPDYPAGPYFDTMIASWLLDVTKRKSLDECVARELGEVLEKGVGKNIDDHEFDVVARYSLLDAEFTFRLYQSYYAKLSAEKRLTKLLRLEMETLHPVLEMEATGVRLDLDRLTEIGQVLDRKRDEAEASAYRAAGRRFSLTSPKERQQALFAPRSEGGQGLRPGKVVDSKRFADPSTLDIYSYKVDREFLAANQHNEVAAAMLEYSVYTKLITTYVHPYLGDADVVAVHRNSRLYAQFNQSGTESGRFSSSRPNLQTVPSRGEGRMLREVFVADPGCTLVVADYSQIEPRIIAALSGDKTMVETYKVGGDVYMAVADRMNVERRAGKQLVLAIAYGVGAKKIASEIGCTVKEAKDLMDYFNHTFRAIPRLKSKVVAEARKKRYAETIFGRRRPLPEIASRVDEDLRARAERQAFNTLIQGSAADVMKIALVNIHSSLPDGAKILMTVHDEVVVQTPDDTVDDVLEVVKTGMESARHPRITVPLVAEVGVGHSWGEAK